MKGKTYEYLSEKSVIVQLHVLPNLYIDFFKFYIMKKFITEILGFFPSSWGLQYELLH
jgi:hypothetical protein